MPGILPMKVIKVGASAQTRIAQACDRCRSKKIRCDGIRPSCTQCVNVGFECKTSDKLSRRAFPRGYTESLEERVRLLETEVKDLKALLDEKDEKIDMLSRIHSHSPQSMMSSPRKPSFSSPASDNSEPPPDPNDVFKVVQSPVLLDEDGSNSYFMGTSSGRTLVEAFKKRLQENGQPSSGIEAEKLLQPNSKLSAGHVKPHCVEWKAPPRMVSDQLVNIFFQEWAPLFPIVHRPMFLALYDEYVSCPEAIEDKKSLAQLHLVFGIAALSSDARNSYDIDSFEAQWQAALEEILMDNSMTALQCLALAQIHCLQRGDYARLLKYKGLAISLSHRLGLHQSQKRFALGTLTSETRKKVFWTLYTIDCFSAAQLGLPQLMKEEDIHCEYPVDADDEYVTEKGFLPTLPGEFTKLSSALALFKAARILSKILKENYPASASHEISFRVISSLAEELDGWSSNLPSHLRLQFVQDKPSTNVISSRSPILSMAYHYLRGLIYRPAVCASSTLGDRAASAIVAVGTSSKHIVQILELLEERHLSFSFCLNKADLVVHSGFGLLFQSLDLDRNGALMKDVQRLLRSLVELLDRSSPPASVEFRRIISLLSMSGTPTMRTPTLSRHNSDSNLYSVEDSIKATQRHMKVIASHFTSVTQAKFKHDLNRNDNRRATVPNVALGLFPNQSHTSLSSIRSEPAQQPRSEPALSPPLQRSSVTPTKQIQKRSSLPRSTNLDYLSFNEDGLSATAAYPFAANPTGKGSQAPTDWERLLGSLDNGQANIYDTIYGGQALELLADVNPLSAANQLAWSPEMWTVGNGDALSVPGTVDVPQAPQSVLSFSDESLTSGEEFPELVGVASHSSNGSETYRGIVIPELSPCTGDSALGLVGLDGNFGL